MILQVILNGNYYSLNSEYCLLIKSILNCTLCISVINLTMYVTSFDSCGSPFGGEYGRYIGGSISSPEFGGPSDVWQ